MSKPQDMTAFKDLILESWETRHFLKEKLEPTPNEIISRINSLIKGREDTDSPSETLETISSVIKEFYERDIAQEALDSLRAGEDKWDVLDILQVTKDDEGGDCRSSIEGLGSDEEPFDIEICQIGPLYYIRSNEFDDTEWFGSKEEAIDYAKEEFAPYIEALEEYWENLDDED